MRYQKALPALAMLAVAACSGQDTTAPLSSGRQAGELGSVASSAGSQARSGNLTAVKECSGFDGGTGSFCTIKESSLKEIELESRITYLSPATVFTPAGSDVVLDLPGPGNNAAYGHCALDLSVNRGLCVFSGGTGKFTWFNASLVVSDPFDKSWHLSGPYSFSK